MAEPIATKKFKFAWAFEFLVLQQERRQECRVVFLDGRVGRLALVAIQKLDLEFQLLIERRSYSDSEIRQVVVEVICFPQCVDGLRESGCCGKFVREVLPGIETCGLLQG